MKLKHCEIAEYRLALLDQQQYCCALCLQHLNPEEAVLDHDHKSGYIRGVLHRGCNAFEGKIARSLTMNRINPERLQSILLNFMSYSVQHHAVLHPTHKTPEEKVLARRLKASKQRKKRAS